MRIRIGHLYKVKKKKNGALKVVPRTNEEVSDMFGIKKKSTFERYQEIKQERIALERKNEMTRQFRDEKQRLSAAKNESFKNSALGKIAGVAAKVGKGVAVELRAPKKKKKNRFEGWL